jgi:hypothetical protein
MGTIDLTNYDALQDLKEVLADIGITLIYTESE